MTWQTLFKNPRHTRREYIIDIGEDATEGGTSRREAIRNAKAMMHEPSVYRGGSLHPANIVYVYLSSEGPDDQTPVLLGWIEPGPRGIRYRYATTRADIIRAADALRLREQGFGRIPR